MNTNLLLERSLVLPKSFGPVLKIHMVGSTYLFGKGNDVDYVVLLPEVDYTNSDEYHAKSLLAAGWEIHTTEDYETNINNEIPFFTARKGVNNLICYTDCVGYGMFLGASRAAKLMARRGFIVPENKQERVDVIRAACEGPGFFGELDEYVRVEYKDESRN